MNTPQFDLGTMLSAPSTAIQQIPCDQLHPYHNHKFELYSGERLEDMVASIKENGVLSPIIVQPIEGGYEILIGHNRWNASKLAGLPTVPAIVKTDLTEEEAEMYVIESNVMQRGFENLRISEQAAAVALRHSEMFSQAKRSVMCSTPTTSGTICTTSKKSGPISCRRSWTRAISTSTLMNLTQRSRTL